MKIQMLAGNKLKICVSAGFEISSTLVLGTGKWAFSLFKINGHDHLEFCMGRDFYKCPKDF